jgi:hypothetical protein
MKCKILSVTILFCLTVFTALTAQTDEPIKEAVSVVNVEVPVRVFADGQPVLGLGREDFQIFENNKPQAINGFYTMHKRMQAEPGPESAENVAQGRYFVLVFRTYDWNRQLQAGLEKLFSDILLPDDQLLVMANTTARSFERLGDDDQAQAEIEELLKSESQKAYNQLLSTLKSIEREVNMTKFKMTLSDAGAKGLFSRGMTQDYIKTFLTNYLDAWRTFKRRYLTLDIDKYYYFARHLEKIRKEKWVLNFYQLEMFPQIAFNSEIERSLRNFIDNLRSSQDPTNMAYASMISQTLSDIHKEMSVSDGFPAEEVSKLFYKVNATFHSFFMRTFKDSDDSELQFKNVSTDIENSLRELTRRTGGELLASSDLEESLASIADKPDDYYILTYEPADAKHIGKIKVQVKGKKYDVLYDNNIRADYISEYLRRKEAETPTVKISELSFSGKRLSFVVSDYSLAKLKDGAAGMLSVRIRIKNSDGESVFDQSRNLKADKKSLSLSLEFTSLSAGKHDIIVDVLDQVSGKTCTEVIQPLVR